MKKYILLIFILLGCSEDEPNGPEMGCSTGMRDGKRHLLRCSTRDQHLAGNNEAAGGISYFANYTNWQWEPVKNCQICYDKYQ